MSKVAEQQRALGPYKYLHLKYPFAELNISAVEGSLNLITSAPQACWCSCFEHRQEQHFYCVICTFQAPSTLTKWVVFQQCHASPIQFL